MLHAGRIQWLTLLLFFPVVLLGMGGGAFTSMVPAALAADSQVEHSKLDCTAEQHGPSFGGSVVVDTGQVLCSDLTSYGGMVAINGEVRGDVLAFGGDIVIAGTVDGNVDIYGGAVTLKDTSHVHGDLNLYASSLTRGQHVQLDGTTTDHTSAESLFLSASRFHFSFWPLVVWVALGLLLVSLLPEHSMFVRVTMVRRLRRSLVIGVLSALLALPVLVVLIAFIVTIPLAIIVALGLIVAWAFGTIALGWLVGEHVVRMVAPQHNTRPIQVVVGLTVLVLAGSLPYIGFLISIGAGLLGLGAVFLSRFGTRLYGKLKQPLIL